MLCIADDGAKWRLLTRRIFCWVLVVWQRVLSVTAMQAIQLPVYWHVLPEKRFLKSLSSSLYGLLGRELADLELERAEERWVWDALLA
jgi:hypothetical protein